MNSYRLFIWLMILGLIACKKESQPDPFFELMGSWTVYEIDYEMIDPETGLIIRFENAYDKETAPIIRFHSSKTFFCTGIDPVMKDLTGVYTLEQSFLNMKPDHGERQDHGEQISFGWIRNLKHLSLTYRNGQSGNLKSLNIRLIKT